MQKSYSLQVTRIFLSACCTATSQLHRKHLAQHMHRSKTAGTGTSCLLWSLLYTFFAVTWSSAAQAQITKSKSTILQLIQQGVLYAEVRHIQTGAPCCCHMRYTFSTQVSIPVELTNTSMVDGVTCARADIAAPRMLGVHISAHGQVKQ